MVLVFVPAWRPEALGLVTAVFVAVELERRRLEAQVRLRLELCPRYSADAAMTHLLALSHSARSPRLRAAILARLATVELASGQLERAFARYASLRLAGWRARQLSSACNPTDARTVEALATLAVLEALSGGAADAEAFLEARGAQGGEPSTILLRVLLHALRGEPEAARELLSDPSTRDRTLGAHTRLALETLRRTIGARGPYRVPQDAGDSWDAACAWLSHPGAGRSP